MTVRLYFADAQRTRFDAHMLDSRRGEAGWEVALDRTCFYPTGGGQPHDTGTLAGIPVVDVYEEDETVWHVLPQLPPEADVTGEIDWDRRFDHMQQHSGQHILSAVALERLGAQTVSFHLGAETTTIDLDVPEPTAPDVELLEEETNRLVMADIPVRSYFVAPEDVAALNLRKPPTKGERPRIVEVVGVDLSPCGGTHVRSTGQIGLIKLRRLEHYKGGTRVEFLCGGRALRDYQWKHAAIMSLARDLSVADRDLEATLRRLLDSEKEAQRELEALRGQMLAYEAASLHESAQALPSFRLVVRSFSDREPAEVKRLASMLAANPRTVALLASQSPSVRIFFTRSEDVDLDMRWLLRQITGKYGGGGGGRPEGAEGGGMPSEQAVEALAWAAELLG